MPELPEVETIKRVIEPQIQGTSIEQVTISRPEVIAHPCADEFCELLRGQVIAGMRRRGKFLAFMLENGSYVVLHLRMTGCLLVCPPDMPKETHTHIVFQLSNQMELRFSDTRRFGRFWLIRRGETDTYSGIGKLGIEPSAPELTAEYLVRCFGKRRKAVKECLLEQGAIAGIGNIYSDEILFEAGIYPGCPANRLKYQDWERLAAVIPGCLSYFIEKNQLSPEEYLQGKGRDYRNTPFLKVYGHAGKPCRVCGTALSRTVIGGRSSTFCPNCQREIGG